MASTRLAIIGGGAWGMAFAQAYSNVYEVSVYLRRAEHIQAIQTTGIHPLLPNIQLNTNIKFHLNLDTALNNTDLIILATPSNALADVLLALKNNPYYQNQALICLSKGFYWQKKEACNEYLFKFASQLIEELLPNRPYGILTGPSFAQEFADRKPCALTIASTFKQSLNWQKQLSLPNVRIYTNDDLIGVQIGGALKNIIAIAAGICDGLQLGLNAQAALITRGLAEMMRFSSCIGGKPESLMGLSGLGDLVLTATGGLSRNRHLGQLIAQGYTLTQAQTQLGHVAEGVYCTEIMQAWCVQLHLDLPIIQTVYQILFNNKPVKQAIEDLLNRQLKQESV